MRIARASCPWASCARGSGPSVEGEVLLTEVAFRGRRQMLCRIGDGSGFLTLRFFYFTAQQQQGLARGARVRCFGEARRGPKGLEFVHPEYRRVDPQSRPAARRTSHADLSHDRRRDPGTAAPAGQLGAGPDGRSRTRGLAAAGVAGRFAPAVACATHCCTCTGRPPMRRWNC